MAKKLILLFVLIVVPNSILADTVYLNSGEIIEGKISYETDEFIWLNMKDESLVKTYYYSEIKNIDRNLESIMDGATVQKPTKSGGVNTLFDTEYSDGTFSIFPKEDNLISSGLFYGLILGVWIVMTLPIFIISNKTGRGDAYFAFIPLVNFLLLLEIADRPKWWFWAAFLPIIPPFSWNPLFQLLSCLILIPVWMGVAKQRKHNSMLAFLIVVPILGQIIEWYMALVDEPRI